MLLLVFVGSCAGTQSVTVNPLETVLSSKNPNIKRVMDSVAQYEVQVRYTQIGRQRDSVHFTDYDFQVDADHYFYPASTVKFPAAVLALQKLNGTDSLDLSTRFYVEGDSVETTFAEAISQIFAVSDNDANNRLVEFLGQDAINNGLQQKGVRPVRISHRLGRHSDNLITTPLIVYLNDSTVSQLQGTVNTPPETLELKSIRKGKGFYEEDVLVSEPFDFSLKNYYPIDAQHGLLKRIIFPESFPRKERFDLSEAQREFLLTAMHTVPRKVGYDPVEYYDGYCKFFMFGDTKKNIPENIQIYNKVGFAYGTLTDCAYITDTENKVEFMLTATILVNQNGIFNDDTYEYDEVGIPFLAELGRQLYDYELSRKKWIDNFAIQSRTVSEAKQTRINKYLSEVGYCSRRAADKLIEQGRVTINGKIPEMGTKVTDGDEVHVDGKRISESEAKPVYLAFNKPVGIVCTTDTRVEKDNIIDFIGYPKRIFPIGRLDKPSEGLILLTDDGDIVNKILRARNHHEKEYLVTVDRPLTSEFLQQMGNGVPILDTVTRKCKVEQIGDYEFKITLTQGLNRQIRRMCEHLEYRVKRLKRIRIMNVILDVPVGKWRDLTGAELNEIQRLIASSSKTPS